MDKYYSSHYYGKDAGVFISYEVPSDSLLKRFDFYKTDKSEEDKNINTKEISGIIEEIHDNYVIVNCMIDPKRKITQRRKFDKAPLIGKFNFFEGEGLKIIIRTQPGKREFIYQKNEESKLEFEKPEDLFSKYRGTSLFPNS